MSFWDGLMMFWAACSLFAGGFYAGTAVWWYREELERCERAGECGPDREDLGVLLLMWMMATAFGPVSIAATVAACVAAAKWGDKIFDEYA